MTQGISNREVGKEAQFLRHFANAVEDDVQRSDCFSSNLNPLDAILERMAGASKEYFDATNCDIWVYDRLSESFKCGATYQLWQPYRVRDGGWSFYLLEHLEKTGQEMAVRFTNIRSESDFARHTLDAETDQWTDGPDDGPKSLNANCVKVGSRGVIGYSFKISHENVGLLWLYSDSDLSSESSESTHKLRKILGHIATLWVMRKRTAAATVFGRIAREYEANIFGTSGEQVFQLQIGTEYPRLPSQFQMLDLAVRRTILGEFGGDFFGWSGQPEAFTVIAGDAEGHGITGALGSLQALAAFESSSRHYRSTREIFREVAFSIRRTACEFVVLSFVPLAACESDRPRFIVYYSSGGMQFLVYRAREQSAELFPKRDGIASGAKVFAEILHPTLRVGDNHQIESLPGEESFVVEEGDVVVIFSDGITEASKHSIYSASRLSEQFGTRGVQISLLEACRHNVSANKIVSRIFADSEMWCSSLIHDDRCVLAIVVRALS
jgi:serine phosphatase RsbU (regulator of sigma subunit)